MRVFVTDATYDFSAEPILMGISNEGLNVCCRINDFQYSAYLEPLRKSLPTKEEAQAFLHTTVVPSLRQAGIVAGIQVVSMGRLCGAVGQSWFVRVQHKSAWKLKKLAIAHLKLVARVYNHDLDPILVFLHHTGIRCFDYMSVDDSLIKQVDETRSKCQVEFSVSFKGLTPPSTEGDLVEMMVASFDLETDGLDPSIHEIRMVSVYWATFPWTDVDAGETLILCRHDMTMEPPPNYKVEIVDSEKKLLQRLIEVLAAKRPVFLTGWNIAGFDLGFIYKRAEKLECLDGLFDPLSLLKRKVKGRHKELITAAFGHNELFLLDLVGMHVVDGVLLARKAKAQLKIDNAKLDTFAKWIGREKGDVKYEDMVRAFTTRDPDLLREVADYCAQDSRLVPAILQRLEEPTKNCAMARLAVVPIGYVLDRGQQVLTKSLIYDEARRRRMVINSFPPPSWYVPKEGYQGATVIEPSRGYYEEPVLVLDFKSLYPSCMLAYNVCLSTKVRTCTFSESLKEVYPWPRYTIADIGQGRVSIFDRERDGVIPTVLRQLLSKRQAQKDAMKTCEKGSIRYQQHNVYQDAIKRSANSVYGYLGSETTGTFAVDLAAAVTSLGRAALMTTKGVIQEMKTEQLIPSDTHIIYGDTDSVMVCLPNTSVLDAEAIGHAISKRTTDTFPKPMELEFEVILKPYLLVSKKRYAGKSWISSTETGKQIIKGLGLVRGDYSQVVKDGMRGVLDALLDSTDGKGAERAIHAVQSIMQGFVDRSVGFDDLVISKCLSKKDYRDDPAHVAVAKKIEEREPHRAPKTGDRVSFIIIRSTNAKASVTERAEDPEYALENNLEPDYGYYAQKTGDQVLDLLKQANLDHIGRRIVTDAISKAKTLVRGQRSLDTFLSEDHGPKNAPAVISMRPKTTPISIPRQTSLHGLEVAPTIAAPKRATKKTKKDDGRQQKLTRFFG